MPEMHRCIDCGFFGLRHLDTREIREAEGDFRTMCEMDAAGIPKGPDGGDWAGYQNQLSVIYEPVPLCTERKRDFLDEVFPRGTIGQRTAIRFEFGTYNNLVVPFECTSAHGKESGFTTWQQGFTPKEHRETLDRQSRIDEEDEIRKTIWEREDKRDAEMRCREDKRDQQVKGRHRTDLLVFGAVVSICTMAGGVLDGVVSRGLNLWPF